jgi:hypothetical protein
MLEDEPAGPAAGKILDDDPQESVNLVCPACRKGRETV